MSLRPPRLVPVVALAAALALAGCGDDDPDPVSSGAPPTAAPAGTPASAPAPTPEPEVQQLEVVVHGGEHEYAFDIPAATLEAGPVELTLVNHGAEMHAAQLLRLHDGVDAGAFFAAAAEDPVSALALADAAGGPTAVAPGGSASTTQEIEAGEYLLICLIPGADGIPHAAKGMVTPITVTESSTDVAAGHDHSEHPVVSLVDFGFVPPSGLQPGQTIAVRNDGDQVHEVALFRLDEGATPSELLAAMEDPAAGPPPGRPAGGLSGIAPGTTAELTLPEEPGRYALLCFFPDSEGDGRPHIALGMVAELTLG